MSSIEYSLIVPVFNNKENLPDLLDALKNISTSVNHALEVVWVLDGGKDESRHYLDQHLPEMPFYSKTLIHSRNFGAFSAIRTGLEAAEGAYCAVMAADLQEPPKLIMELFENISDQSCDVVVAYRDQRQDGFISKLFSELFWWIYRSFVIPEIPTGGIGTIACTKAFKEELLGLEEKGSSMIGLIYWLGFRRKEIPYQRQKRKIGKSSWSLSKKINYFFDSIFSFSDLPIKILIAIGALGFIISTIMGAGLLINKMLGLVPNVPGYASTFIAILFFSCINIVGLGIIGAYVWRAFTNTQQRPAAIVMERKNYPAKKK